MVASIGGFNPMMIAGLGVGGAVLYLREEAKEHGEGGGGGGEKAPSAAEALAALNDKTMPMSQRLSVAMNALKGIDPTNQLASMQTQLKAAQDALTAKETDLTKAKADLDAANLRIKAMETDVQNFEAANAKLETENKDLRAKEQDIEKRATAKAEERVAALGFPASKLPGADPKAGDDKAAAAFAAYGEIKDPGEKAKYYAAHIVPLISAKQGLN